VSVTEPGLRRLRMSWEDYVALPDEVRAEWVDGEVVVSPRPSLRHGVVVTRVGSLLQTALPALVTVSESGVWLPGNRLRGPDVMVLSSLHETTWAEEPPVIVVEVLSPSTHREDTTRESGEYAEGGVGQYWVVDPDHRTVDVYLNRGGGWDLLLHLDEPHPAGEVAVGDHGVVPLDLTTLLPPA